jgi:hypothetical protein
MKDEDVELVDELTEGYIAQPRIICLAIIATSYDYANQGIITKVQKVDPDGIRTLGIITKPDRVEESSGGEQAFINLARNKYIFFKLGWHVLRNQDFANRGSSFLERNVTENNFFCVSNFSVLPKNDVGIDALRERLSHLQFEHVKNELPRLREDIGCSYSITVSARSPW